MPVLAKTGQSIFIGLVDYWIFGLAGPESSAFRVQTSNRMRR
jgi:hypothetical protein